MVIAGITVNMVNDLMGGEIASKMLFHYETMFQYVFQAACLLGIGGVGVVVGRNYQDVPVFANLLTALPAWGLVFALAIHGVGFAFLPSAIHRVLFARNVTTERGISRGEVTGSHSTTFGAIALVGLAGGYLKSGATLQALNCYLLGLRGVGTTATAKLKAYAGVCIVGFAAVLAGASYHRKLLLSGEKHFNIIACGRRYDN